MNRLMIIAILASIFILPGAVKAEDYREDGLDRIFFTGYKPDSAFVTVPADVGNFIGLIVGSIPAALTAGVFHFFGAPEYQSLEAGSVAIRFFTYPLGFVVGLPFKALKIVFWEAPATFFASAEDDAVKPFVKVNQESEVR